MQDLGSEMPSTYLYQLVGDSHTRGYAGGETGGVRPRVLGPSEQYIELLDLAAGLGGLVVGDIIEQAPLTIDIRARIVHIFAQDATTASFIVEPGAADAASNLWPTTGDDPSYAWDMYAQVKVNGPLTTAVITRVETRSIPEVMNDPDLERVTTQDVFYDPRAKLAQTIDIDGYTDTPNTNYLQPGDRISCSPSGATFVVAGYEVTSGTTARVYVCRIIGTPQVGDNCANDQVFRDLSGVTISAIGATTTAGRWVPYCATPSLARRVNDAVPYPINNIWDVPPRGNATFGVAGLGPDVKLVKNIERHHIYADDVGDRGHRLLTFSSNDDSPGNGFRGGVALQRLSVTGQAGTWAAGDAITSAGSSWTAKVGGTNSAGVVYVYDTNGETLGSGEALTTSSGGTATSTGPVFGWRKGSKFWNDWMALRATALAADGATEGAAPIADAGLFLMIWEGEIAPFANIGDVPGLALFGWYAANLPKMRQQWVEFIAELRTEFSAPDLPVTMWLHNRSAQRQVLTGGGLLEGIINATVRTLFEQLPVYIDELTITDSHERGHQMAQIGNGELSQLFLRTLDYVDLGQAMWSLVIEPTLSAPPGNFEVLPVVVVAASQSQQYGFISTSTWVGVDQDPDLWPVSSFPGVNFNYDTRDANVLVWNHAAEELQIFDAAENDNTFWQEETTNGQSGPTVALMQRMKMRYGDGATSGKVALFKAAVSGSCYGADVIGAPGCWDPDVTVRPAITVSITVSHVMVGATQYARFTAAPGTWTGVLQDGHSIVIDGSAGMQSAGGNNTPRFETNSARTFESTDGSFFDLPDAAGTRYADGTETLTVRIGPPPIWPELERQWRLFITKSAKAGYVPQPVALISEHGESDLFNTSTYAPVLQRIWDSLIALCGLRSSKKDIGIAKCLVLLHRDTPFADSQAQIDAIRSAQAAQASLMPDCKLLDPSGLPFERSGADLMLSSPPFPRQYRRENGIHITQRAMITKGYLIDQALGTLSSLIPTHPRGDVQLFGAVNNGATLEIGQGVDDLGTIDGGDAGTSGTDAPSVISTLTSSQIDGMMSAIEAAWSEGSDVFSYTVNGTTVTRNTPEQMIELHRYLLAIKQQTAGIRRTTARFN